MIFQMKKTLFLFLLGITLNSLAQSPAVPDPEFPNRPYYLKDGKLESLEKVSTSFDVSGMGSKVYLTAFKPKSEIHFTKDAIPALYIKIEGGGDPSDKVTVSIATVKKDRRRFVQESTGMTGAAKDISATKVNVSLKKVRDGLYQIVFDTPLAPGEYAFMPQMDMGSLMSGGKLTLFCFGVD
jgi:hypothetical protein